MDDAQRAAEEKTNWGDPDAVVESVNSAQPDQGDELGPVRFAGAVEVILAIGAVWIAKRIVEHVLAGGGAFIDLRTSPPTVNYLKTVRRNTALIVRPDGTTESIKFDQDEGKLTDLIAAALSGAGNGN
jgi:hypothetical protein